MQTVDRKLIAGIESRREKRESLNMIPMSVAHEDVPFDGTILELTDQGQSQESNPRAGIKDQQLFTTPNLGAGSVASIFQGGLSRCRNGAARAPKANGKSWWVFPKK